MKKLQIGVDLDDVLAEYVPALTTYTEFRLGRVLSPPQTWEFSAQWGLTKEKLLWFMRNFALGENLKDLQVVEGSHSLNYLAEWRAKGHEVKIITARAHLDKDTMLRHEIIKDTTRWLRFEGVPFDDLIFTANKSEVMFDVLIDDAPHHLTDAWANKRNAIAFDRPWNQRWGGFFTVDKTFRAKTWSEVNSIITKLEEEV